MKRLTIITGNNAFVKFLVFIGMFFCLLLYGCDNSSSDNTLSSGYYIHGVAAKGAVLPKGSRVELRSAAVDGIPSEIKKTTVSDDNGSYSIDVTGLTKPFLIRVLDESTGTWYYSYTESSQSIANVNPLTDAIIKSFYINSSTISNSIESTWSTGYYNNTVDMNGNPVPANTPIVMPDVNSILKIKNILINCVSLWYGITVTDDLFTTNWVVGEGYDAILDSMGINSTYATTITNNASTYPNYVSSYYVYTTIENSKIYLNCKILTTGSIVRTMIANNESLTLISTDSNGVHTFTGKIDITSWLNDSGLAVSDYNTTFFEIDGVATTPYAFVLLHK